MNHTHGPWKMALDDSEPNEAFVHWPYGYAVVHGSRTGREANARLIAAAPDMLAALFGVVRVADRATDEFDAARAAIAKATGEAP